LNWFAGLYIRYGLRKVNENVEVVVVFAVKGPSGAAFGR
jgi:hypothetical protein